MRRGGADVESEAPGRGIPDADGRRIRELDVQDKLVRMHLPLESEMSIGERQVVAHVWTVDLDGALGIETERRRGVGRGTDPMKKRAVQPCAGDPSHQIPRPRCGCPSIIRGTGHPCTLHRSASSSGFGLREGSLAPEPEDGDSGAAQRKGDLKVRRSVVNVAVQPRGVDFWAHVSEMNAPGREQAHAPRRRRSRMRALEDEGLRDERPGRPPGVDRAPARLDDHGARLDAIQIEPQGLTFRRIGDVGLLPDHPPVPIIPRPDPEGRRPIDLHAAPALVVSRHAAQSEPLQARRPVELKASRVDDPVFGCISFAVYRGRPHGTRERQRRAHREVTHRRLQIEQAQQIHTHPTTARPYPSAITFVIIYNAFQI